MQLLQEEEVCKDIFPIEQVSFILDGELKRYNPYLKMVGMGMSNPFSMMMSGMSKSTTTISISNTLFSFP